MPEGAVGIFGPINLAPLHVGLNAGMAIAVTNLDIHGIVC
jgi:hypothetical protein